MQGNFSFGLADTHLAAKLILRCKYVGKQITCKLRVHKAMLALMQGNFSKWLIGRPCNIQPPAHARKFVDNQSLSALQLRWPQVVVL
jgi:hypothetical protein